MPVIFSADGLKDFFHKFWTFQLREPPEARSLAAALDVKLINWAEFQELSPAGYLKRYANKVFNQLISFYLYCQGPKRHFMYNQLMKFDLKLSNHSKF